MATTKNSKSGGSKGAKPVATKKAAAEKKPARVQRTQKKKHGGKRDGSGRPPGPWKFKTVEQLDKKIQAYFDHCNPHWEWHGIYQEKKDDNGKPIVIKGKTQYEKISIMRETKQVDYTVSGLCLWLDTNRETLGEYESGKYDLPQDQKAAGQLDFSDTIRRAKLAIENYTELKSLGPNPSGAIFNLANNWGYKHKSEVDNKNTGEQRIIVETRKYDASSKD